MLWLVVVVSPQIPLLSGNADASGVEWDGGQHVEMLQVPELFNSVTHAHTIR